MEKIIKVGDRIEFTAGGFFNDRIYKAVVVSIKDPITKEYCIRMDAGYTVYIKENDILRVIN